MSLFFGWALYRDRDRHFPFFQQEERDFFGEKTEAVGQGVSLARVTGVVVVVIASMTLGSNRSHRARVAEWGNVRKVGQNEMS